MKRSYFQHRLSAERWCLVWSFHSWKDNGKFYLVNFIPKMSYLSHLQRSRVHSSWSWSTASASLGILVCRYQHIPAKQCYVIQLMHCYLCNLQWQRRIQDFPGVRTTPCMHENKKIGQRWWGGGHIPLVHQWSSMNIYRNVYMITIKCQSLHQMCDNSFPVI